MSNSMITLMIIMGVLITVAVVLMVIIITALVRNKQAAAKGDYDEEDDYDEENEDRAERNFHLKGKDRQEQEPGRTEENGLTIIGDGRRLQEGEEGSEEESDSRAAGKKLWKLALENLSTWQKSTFIFYDNIGIGRGHSVPQFEKFLSISDDPRVSKLHCAIIQKDDRLYLKDMGSRNGTYLNKKRITQPVLLQKDDVIGMGETELEIQSLMREK